ncbi:MAG: CRTAC1 family protein [Acidobacteria bacterium]|nr:CRTAC1 family protein [Acidobacteriota bacterium]
MNISVQKSRHLLTFSISFFFLLTALPLLSQPRDLSEFESIVDAIEELEGTRDPKCHATASRLEDFMYGTPLTPQAREKKVELQKDLILGVWSRGSEEARREGLAEVPPGVLRSRTGQILPRKKESSGDVVLQPDGQPPIVLRARDIEHYGSVAYALRAILSVQQDLLLSDLDLLPLAPESVDVMKELIDLGTLGALGISDRMARNSGAYELTADMFSDGWKVFFGTDVDAPRTDLALDSRELEPGSLLRKIVEQKIASYDRYNAVEGHAIFWNIQGFYTRHDWPEDPAAHSRITSTFAGVMRNFVRQFVTLAEDKAREEGEPVVRERHLAEVLNLTVPYDLNEYEDITYFYHLSPEEQVVIESYDADSFRDARLHWFLIKQVLEEQGFELDLDWDPFAAELLAEGTAQIGVLLYRMAGIMAKEEQAAVFAADHLVSGARLLVSRMSEHLSTPPPSTRSQPVASAAGATRRSGEWFEEVTDEVGLKFVHRSADWLRRFERTFRFQKTDLRDTGSDGPEAFMFNNAPVFSGSGVAADDLNGDGLDDIVIVGGFGNGVFVNSGDGTFRDMSDETSLTFVGDDRKPGEPRQPIIADFDNDGRQDVLITYVDATHRLYRNLGDLKFEDVSEAAGLGGEGLVGSAAAVADFDRDGLLDIYICYYGNYLQGDRVLLARINDGTTPNRIFRNLGDFRFEDRTAGSGVDNTGWSQAVAAVDFDADGWQDLIVGNDFGVNSYYRNLGDGTFEDISRELRTRRPSNSMNVGTADLNRDGYPDIYISNIVTMVKDEKYVLPTATTPMKRDAENLARMRIVDANHLFLSVAGSGKLEGYDFSLAVDRGDTSTGWAWDADFFDFDNDGDDDLYCVNGVNEYNTVTREHKIRHGDTEKTVVLSVHEHEMNVLYVNEGGKLQNRSLGSGAELEIDSRGAAYLDYDDDGDLDIVINNYQEPASFLRNRSEQYSLNWLKVKLVGDPERGSSRDAIGATIIASTPSGNRIWRAVQGGTGYLSHHPKVQHFGLGNDEQADLRIVWPNGETTEHRELQANQLHVISQVERRDEPEATADKEPVR